MRRVLFVVGWAVGGALAWAIIFGLALLFGSDEPADFFEQATFRTEEVSAVAGTAAADGPCGESKDGKGTTRTHGTSYKVGLTWTDADGEQHQGVMTTCNRPDQGQPVTVWVSSRDAVFNRSPLAMYRSVLVAAVLFALGAWGWTWLKKDERRGSGHQARQREARRRRLRLLNRANRT